MKITTVKEAMALVEEDGGALCMVPMFLRTMEVCLAAAQNRMLGFQYVPQKFKAKVLRKVLMEIASEADAVQAMKRDVDLLEYLPEKLKTPEVCLAAVSEFGGSLEHVPVALKSPELCLAAVKEWDGALRFVPTDLITRELCLAASPDPLELACLMPDEIEAAVHRAMKNMELVSVEDALEGVEVDRSMKK